MEVEETEICVTHRDLMTKWGTGNFAWADCSKGLSYFENCGTVYL